MNTCEFVIKWKIEIGLCILFVLSIISAIYTYQYNEAHWRMIDKKGCWLMTTIALQIDYDRYIKFKPKIEFVDPVTDYYFFHVPSELKDLQ